MCSSSPSDTVSYLPRPHKVKSDAAIHVRTAAAHVAAAATKSTRFERSRTVTASRRRMLQHLLRHLLGLPRRNILLRVSLLLLLSDSTRTSAKGPWTGANATWARTLANLYNSLRLTSPYPDSDRAYCTPLLGHRHLSRVAYLSSSFLYAILILHQGLSPRHSRGLKSLCSAHIREDNCPSKSPVCTPGAPAPRPPSDPPRFRYTTTSPISPQPRPL